jgi:hypothetical protein
LGGESTAGSSRSAACSARKACTGRLRPSERVWSAPLWVGTRLPRVLRVLKRPASFAHVEVARFDVREERQRLLRLHSTAPHSTALHRGAAAEA